MNELPYDADAELEALYAAITGRPSFRYDALRDPLYRGYADRYIQNGRMAMRDSMGSAAALTGGYGSSYAQAAGQQQYDEYLRSLSEVLPELYGLAYQQYTDQGAALRDAYNLSWQRRESDYQRGRDALADERYAAEQEAAAAQQSYKQQQDRYNQLYKLISATGYSPADNELEKAGLSRAQANALRQEYLRAKGLLPGAGGSSTVYVSRGGTGSDASAATVAAGKSGLSGIGASKADSSGGKSASRLSPSSLARKFGA